MTAVDAMPQHRPDPFDPPADLTDPERDPVRRMRYADGHLGWLVTGYEQARAVLADPRMSVRPELAHQPDSQPTNLTVPAGFFLRMDPPQHERYRRLLTGRFTVRRIRALEPGITAIVDEALDSLAAAGSPADLVSTYALPIPSLVICELLGVPYADRGGFQRDSARMLNLQAPAADRNAAVGSLLAYLSELVADKRRTKPDDLLGDLAASGAVTDEELAGIALLLLLAGHETTANMIAHATFALLQRPEQLALLRDDPDRAAGAADELLRHLSVLYLVLRTATADLELDGHAIRAGETVTVSLAAANRDAGRFPGPDALRLDRDATGHLAFGHGIHQCLGQQLARTELRIALPALLRRFPGLRLAVPAEDVPMRTEMAVYGVHRLPVAW
ncbi:cytochrome P450 [Actinocatenispora rupis]|uniref:Cytochrome P450 n=1 Tax=Actinocatenispora rupis TaxID=519421 RepID=A0A8J3J4S9_9ACTN|nr:cytochrome P450 [Actinocatenispora rupis]GID12145.1 cytochrome P450 [Actinocatenispora rupis]